MAEKIDGFSHDKLLQKLNYQSDKLKSCTTGRAYLAMLEEIYNYKERNEKLRFFNMKIRCSALGRLMTVPRNKSEVLSQTAKSYIQELVLEEKFGIKKEFSSRYTDKGLQCEDEAISLVNDVLGLGFIFKNEEHFNNEFITGTPDVNTNEILLDIKCSYEAHTFPFFETEIPTKDYFYQLQGYMWLTGKTEALLCYCLVNTPL